MFWKKKHPASSPQHLVRASLLGNRPLAEAAAFAQQQSLYEEPWHSYVRAQELIQADRPQDALHLLEQLSMRPNLASEHYAQVYHHLRDLGSRMNLPLRLLGVVVEVGKGQAGYDLLGAYMDRSAQYYPHEGGSAQWKRPNASLDEAVGMVITMGEVLLGKLPLWQGRTLPPISGNDLRVTLVASRGLYVLEGTTAQLTQSMIVDRLHNAAEKLMQKMRGLLQE